MPKISKQKRDRISEQILHHLFEMSPEPIFTNKIAQEVARDEEFTKAILQELKSKDLVLEVNKNSKGIEYLRRQRWRLSNTAFKAYSRQQ